MATLTIRKLDDEVYARLKAKAKANSRSLEAEVRMILEDRSRDRAMILADLRESHHKRVAEHGYWQGDSVELLRRMRDEE